MSPDEAAKEEWTLDLPLQFWRNPDGIAAGFLAFTGENAARVADAGAFQKFEHGRRGNFGSVKVVSRIGHTEWANALYPEKDGSWGLPVKKAVRLAERLEEGDMVTVTLRCV